jgi:NTE family protein
LALMSLLLLGACATRPVNPPITQIDPRPDTASRRARPRATNSRENLVILAFSGGGTRAAAFSYGVLEFLRRTEVVAANGAKFRLIDSIDVITGVSGGSFTALAYGLYGDKLFDDYVQRFLKRNVQGEIISRAFSPRYWETSRRKAGVGPNWRSQLYDEILFNGATFGDLNRGKGPIILASATDISTGSRFVFNQGTFDIICSDLNAVPLSRAAAASSAVPVVLSSITIKNYGGTCNWSPARGRGHSWTARTRRDLPHVRSDRSGTCKRLATASAGPISISSTAAYRTTWVCAACSMRWKSSKRCTRSACRRRSTARKGSSCLS